MGVMDTDFIRVLNNPAKTVPKEKTNMEYLETEKKTRMELIIPIFKTIMGEAKEEVNSVSARELHEGLGSKRDFSAWVKRKVKGNAFFTEGEDWILLPNIGEGQPRTSQPASANKKEYALTLKAAKKVAMSEQTAKGNEVRVNPHR